MCVLIFVYNVKHINMIYIYIHICIYIYTYIQTYYNDLTCILMILSVYYVYVSVCNVSQNQGHSSIKKRCMFGIWAFSSLSLSLVSARVSFA